MPNVNGAKSHPAETLSLAAAIAVLIVHLLGVTDPDVLAALVVVVGGIPAVVTGAVGLLRRGRPPGA